MQKSNVQIKKKMQRKSIFLKSRTWSKLWLIEKYLSVVSLSAQR